MEEERKLHPFTFCRIQDDYVWGSEEFQLADLGYRDSLVGNGRFAGNLLSEMMDTYMDRMVGDNVFTFWGRQFPVQVKDIRVTGKMPLRVHPDAETAGQRYDCLGREKLWYVKRAGRDACLMLGFKRDTDAGEVYAACGDGSIGELLNCVAPHEGQYFHIRPGVPHAASGEVELVEISESSSLDFCLCAWGQALGEEEFDSSFTLADALDFIDYRAFSADKAPLSRPDGAMCTLLDLPEFSVASIKLSAPLSFDTGTCDAFIVYTCLKGAASVQLHIPGDGARFPLKAGETMLVPAECPGFRLVPEAADTEILETTVRHREEKDAYINP
ncbi:MAG: hypothetical protein J5871_04005 [Bacteroidales bacterium]|nr:hypothetical protein [Bacteroidales bacterium]